jgi:hypothetical protein
MKDSELRMIETMLKKQDELNSAIMKEFGLTTISKEQIYVERIRVFEGCGMMKVFLVENINDIHDEFVREACARLDRKIWDLIGFSTRFISMESCLEQITNYIVKLERENFGLKEYKKHQEKANERRYRGGEESWHRGSAVAKKK